MPGRALRVLPASRTALGASSSRVTLISRPRRPRGPGGALPPGAGLSRAGPLEASSLAGPACAAPACLVLEPDAPSLGAAPGRREGRRPPPPTPGTPLRGRPFPAGERPLTRPQPPRLFRTTCPGHAPGAGPPRPPARPRRGPESCVARRGPAPTARAGWG